MARITKTGNNEKAFTLIELVTIMAIIATLASLAMPTFQRHIIRSREVSLSRTLFVFRDVIDQYYADHGNYPESLEALVEKQYIRKIPTDPFTRSDSTWVLIHAASNEGGGIVEVHSGSNKVGLNGIPYNEW